MHHLSLYFETTAQIPEVEIGGKYGKHIATKYVIKYLMTVASQIYGQPNILTISGADPGFPVRGGALKKNAPSGGRRENFWGISCEKSRFYAKKSYFFQLRREARKFL
jgi:hypothetical protein